MFPSRSVRAVLVAVCVAFGPRAYASPVGDLRADAWRAAEVTGGALVMDALLEVTAGSTRCRVCSPDPLDARVRGAARWDEPAAARRASDLLANLAVPLAAAGDALRSTGSPAGAGRDALVVAEAASLSSLADTVAKVASARRRPGLPSSGRTGPSGNQSLWSGHTSLAFSIAVAQATQDSLRGDPAAPWVWLVGVALAGSVGYLRVAGDAHWLSDVLAGAAAGSAFGVGVPLLERRLVHGVTISARPGALALKF